MEAVLTTRMHWQARCELMGDVSPTRTECAWSRSRCFFAWAAYCWDGVSQLEFCPLKAEPMPLLKKEVDLYPENVFTENTLPDGPQHRWWAIYTRSRREKDLMRRLLAMQIPFYGPTVEKRKRTSTGRVRKSYLPLFTNYVFAYGDDESYYQAMTTNCISRCIPVKDSARLVQDLRRLHQLITTQAAVTLEEKLQAGIYVRVKTGPFAGQEGVVVQRRKKRRLLVVVDFLQKGASVELDDFVVETI